MFGPSRRSKLNPLLFLVIIWTPKVKCFVTPVHNAGTTFRHPTSRPSTTSEETETLSDVDARVLRSMLQENKLDLDTEDDVRKLLERGTVKSIPKAKVEKTEEESEFSSQILKTLADTKLWKKMSAQAADALESVSLWVQNKVEQDVKVLGALGLFAWDRAVRDVGRALPAAGAQAKKILILTNTSSYLPTPQGQPTRNVVEQMNRPVDEIKSVSRELFGILSGERTTAVSSGRGLRTAAPAGTGNAAERQRRAYQQRRKLDKQQKDVTKIGGSVVDTAWELRRELKAETNVPGYKTEPIRNAIEAGVAATGKVLLAAREEARLAAAKRKELRLQEARTESASDLVSSEHDILQAESIEAAVETKITTLSAIDAHDSHAVETEHARSDPEQEKLLLSELKAERARIVGCLSKCIDDPGDTWLTPSVIDRLENLDFFSGSGMQDALTKMILLKDEIQDPAYDKIASSLELAVGQLLTIRTSIENLCSLTASEVSDVIADELRFVLLCQNRSHDEKPLILRLEEVARILTVGGEVSSGEMSSDFFAADIVNTEAAIMVPDFKVKAGIITPEIFDVIPDSVVVDAIPDAFVMESQTGKKKPTTVYVEKGIDAAGAGLVAEIVTDDYFENAVGATKVTLEVTGEEETEKEENVLIQATLRSLDVVFFIMERVLTVGVPSTVMTIKTGVTRLEEINRNGKGTIGWEQFRNLADTKGRY